MHSDKTVSLLSAGECSAQSRRWFCAAVRSVPRPYTSQPVAALPALSACAPPVLVIASRAVCAADAESVKGCRAQ